MSSKYEGRDEACPVSTGGKGEGRRLASLHCWAGRAATAGARRLGAARGPASGKVGGLGFLRNLSVHVADDVDLALPRKGGVRGAPLCSGSPEMMYSQRGAAGCAERAHDRQNESAGSDGIADAHPGGSTALLARGWGAWRGESHFEKRCNERHSVSAHLGAFRSPRRACADRRQFLRSSLHSSARLSFAVRPPPRLSVPEVFQKFHVTQNIAGNSLHNRLLIAAARPLALDIGSHHPYRFPPRHTHTALRQRVSRNPHT